MSPQVTLATTAELSSDDVSEIRALMAAAFEDFSDDDWTHALGGWHAIVREEGAIVAHGAVVARRIGVGEREVRAGYVEAVGVRPDRQRQGLGTAVMTALGAIVQRDYDLGVLSSGEWGFYDRLGWERWRGPTFVRLADGSMTRTPDDDDGVMVLRAGVSAIVDLATPICCDDRPGDPW